MSILGSIARKHTRLRPEAVDHLHRLLGEWQLLADLSFSDGLLFAAAGADAFVVLAQVRPFPAQTLYPEDLVGTVVPSSTRPKVTLALAERRIVREGDPDWRGGIPVREETVPVIHRGVPIAVVSLEQNLATARTASSLELAYMRAAGELERMIAEGTFPFEVEEEIERGLSPRVGDGFLEIDESWSVSYASPNAISAFRRLGVTVNVDGDRLDRLGLDDRETLAALAAGKPVENEVEANGAAVLRRFIPIVLGGAVSGAIGLLRDVTELRRRDRMLSIKDATIREIHHRVKNNLQTVASLLRLQARRLGAGEARSELEESVRRIVSIAIVHETLAQESAERVEFDRVAQQILGMAEASLIRPDRPVRFSLQGSAGELTADVATPLSLILTELVQNAIEHGFVARGGTVTVELKRTAPGLHVVVRDDGAGLPEGFSIDEANLGLQIVRTLVTEMLGEMSITADEGTCVEIVVPLAG